MAAQQGALSYPYVAIEDVAWLKRTLLLFPHVTRMIPSYGPEPAEDIEPFTRGIRGGEPLLRRADLHGPVVEEAQKSLAAELEKRLAEDRMSFLNKFGQEASATAGHSRLYPAKLIYELSNFLFQNQLVWHVDTEDHWPAVRMNARLGDAVMATLGHAVARNEGLRLVTEDPALHGKAIRSSFDRIFADFLDDPPRPMLSLDEDAIADMIIYQRCNVKDLTAADIVRIAVEREVYAEFREALTEKLKSVAREFGSQKHYEAALNQIANEALVAWKADRANFSTLAKRVYTTVGADEAKAALIKVAEKLLQPAATGIAGAGVAHGVGVELLPTIATGAGIAIAHGLIKTYCEAKATEDKSPWRYLTVLEKHGVGIRVTG